MDWQASRSRFDWQPSPRRFCSPSPCRWLRCWCWAAAAGSQSSRPCAALPLVLPPTVLGFFLLVLLGPRTAFGRGITALLGHPLAFSFAGLVVGSVIYSLPFAVQPLVAGFAAVDACLG